MCNHLGVILLGEIRCWSLLGVKGLKFHSVVFLKDYFDLQLVYRYKGEFEKF